MIRKFVVATMMIALAGLFYVTDRAEHSRTPATATATANQKAVPELTAQHLENQPDIRN